MKHAFTLWLGLAGLALAGVIETNLETGIILLPFKDAATQAILEQARQDPDPLVRLQAERALATFAGRADPLPVEPVPRVPADLDGALTNIHPAIQQAAVDEIARRQRTEFVPALVGLLTHSDSVLRRHAAEALGVLRQECSAALAARLAEDDDPLVRRALAESLRAIHSEAGRQALLGFLSDPRPSLRTEAIRVLISWPDETVAGAILPLLNDPDPTVVVTAAAGLGELRHQPAVAGLRKLATVFNDEISAVAVEALGKIGDLSVIPEIRKLLFDMVNHGPIVRERAIQALRRLGDRESAKRVLQIVTERVIPPPKGASEPSYDADETRAEGVRYLAHLGDPRWAEAMLSKLEELPSYSVRLVMAEMLSQVTGQPHRAELTTNTRHYFMETRDRGIYPQIPPLPGVRPVERILTPPPDGQSD
jgi:HEAT repeat protein